MDKVYHFVNTYKRAASSDTKLLFNEESDDGTRIIVEDRNGYRYLRFGFESHTQSCIELANPDVPTLDYVRHMCIGLAYVKPKPRILMIGLGGGSVARAIHSIKPYASIDVIERSGTVIQVAKRFFKVKGVNIIQDDGRKYLDESKDKWDLILLDVFDGKFMPPMLTTKEFMELVRDRLEPNGALVWNVFMYRPVYPAMLNTCADVFGYVDTYEVPESGNAAVVSSNTKHDQSDIAQRAGLINCEKIGFDLTDTAVRKKPVKKIDDVVLTDECIQSGCKELFEAND